MAIDSSIIGHSSAPQTFQVTHEAVQRFMEAAEDPALQSGKPIEYAPPTFPTTFRVRVPSLVLDGNKMQLLHGEQAYSYTRCLRIGEEITCVARVVDVRQRDGRSGSMTIIVSELTGTDSEQQHVFTARGTSIVRVK